MCTQNKNERISSKMFYLFFQCEGVKRLELMLRLFWKVYHTQPLFQKKYHVSGQEKFSFHKLCTFKMKIGKNMLNIITGFFFRYSNYSIVFEVNRLSSYNTPNTIFSYCASYNATVFQYNTRDLNLYNTDRWYCTANFNDFPHSFHDTEQWPRYK